MGNTTKEVSTLTRESDPVTLPRQPAADPVMLPMQPGGKSVQNINQLNELPPGLTPITSFKDNLGVHVSCSLKQKIVNGQFIELASLLEHTAINQPEQKIYISNGELITKEKPSAKITSIEKWIDAFLIFTSVYCHAHPSRFLEFLKYMHDIRLGASRIRGMGWRSYDEQFRLRKAVDPSSSWGQVDTELWLKYMLDTVQPSYPQTGHSKCFEFNYKSTCSRHLCNYQHSCIRCSGDHPITTCPLLQQNDPRSVGLNHNFRPPTNRFSSFRARHTYQPRQNNNQTNLRSDIQMWLQFLAYFNGSVYFPEKDWTSSDVVELFTDSAGSVNMGCGAYFAGRWAFFPWPQQWENLDLFRDITFLELLPIVLAIILWGDKLANKKIFFRVFREQQCLPTCWPPPLVHVIQFIAALSLRGLAHSTSRLYVAAISYECKINNLPDVTNNFIITKLLEGMKRLKHRPDTRLPITLDLLSQLINSLPHVCTNLYEAKLFSCAFSLAFFGFMRIGEFAQTNCQATNNVLQLEDVILDEIHEKVILRFRHSKTDQYGKGVTLEIPKTGKIYCPFMSLKHYLGARPSVPGILFCHFGGDPLTRYQFSSVLRKTLSFFNIEFKYYKSHSFRIRAATTASAAGMSDHDIQIADHVIIWCVGSSIIKRAFMVARQRPGGSNLTLDGNGISLWWQGYSGLKLTDIQKKIRLISTYADNTPTYILLHCGGNDIGCTPLKQLFAVVKTLLNFLQQTFPYTRIIWSQILPRASWRYSNDCVAMDKARIRLNSYAAKSVLNSGGAYLKHPDIKLYAIQLYSPDLVHLSDIGNNIFLNSIQSGLQEIINGNVPVYPNL
ncbi:hypothetical protein KUTeg_019991 [Tegillarca granosa]|uniref:C3H1-type domain-containing protein n=1 Tax=Tegillarca granosa TaxID=220873 RepID=A0ABQ9EJ95_TEGGR|nr:hypothetical protein KUTeg_019991 [Tegillarca granosa]